MIMCLIQKNAIVKRIISSIAILQLNFTLVSYVGVTDVVKHLF